VSSAGYSGKTLTQKLGIKPGDVVRAVNPPAHYARLLKPLPAGAVVAADAESLALVHVFAKNRQALADMAEWLVSLPEPGGAVWVSWPKKSSRLFVDLTEGGIRQIMLPTGWVDVKVCAVDADWSGLKFLRRRAARPARVMK
jgi:hypothetical protein